MDWTAILLATLCGGIVLFLWNGIAWMALPHHHGDFDAAPERAEVEKAIAAIPPRGVFYAIPHFKEFEGGMQSTEYRERMREGPNAILVRTGSQDQAQASTFLRAFLVDCFEAFALAVLLTIFLPSTGDRLSTRLLFFVGLGLLSTFPVLANLSNWMGFPMRFAITSTIDKCIGYGFVALSFYLLGTGQAA